MNERSRHVTVESGDTIGGDEDPGLRQVVSFLEDVERVKLGPQAIEAVHILDVLGEVQLVVGHDVNLFAHLDQFGGAER